MSTELFVLALLAALLALNVAITIAVARSDVYSPRQKAIQLALVWLLLVLGTVLVGVVLWSDRAPRGRRAHSSDPDGGTPSWFGDPVTHDVAAGGDAFQSMDP